MMMCMVGLDIHVMVIMMVSIGRVFIMIVNRGVLVLIMMLKNSCMMLIVSMLMSVRCRVVRLSM